MERTIDRLTDELDKTRRQLPQRSRFGSGEPPPPPAKLEVTIFNLRHAEAKEVAATLKELFGLEDLRGNFGGGTAARTPRIATHQSTNCLLVQGTTEEIETIRAIVAQLDEQAQHVPEKTPPTKNDPKKPRTGR